MACGGIPTWARSLPQARLTLEYGPYFTITAIARSEHGIHRDWPAGVTRWRERRHGALLRTQWTPGAADPPGVRLPALQRAAGFAPAIHPASPGTGLFAAGYPRATQPLETTRRG